MAFTAMAHWRLRETEAARLVLRDMESRSASDPGQVDVRVLGSIEEARPLVGARD